MKKATLAVIVFLLIALFVGGMYILFSSKKQTINPAPDNIADIFPTALDTQSTNSSASNNGIQQETDVYQATQETYNPGVLSEIEISEEIMTQALQNATSLEYENEYILADNDLYTIYVISHAQFFDVILKQFPYREGREAAEAYLSNLLGVSLAELCSLHIDVYAPKEFDPTFTTDLGLFACPGPRAPGNV